MRFGRGTGDALGYGLGLGVFVTWHACGGRVDAAIGKFEAEPLAGNNIGRRMKRRSRSVTHQREAAGQHALVGKCHQQLVDVRKAGALALKLLAAAALCPRGEVQNAVVSAIDLRFQTGHRKPAANR